MSEAPETTSATSSQRPELVSVAHPSRIRQLEPDPKSTDLERTRPIVNAEVIGKLDLLEPRS